MTAPLREQFKNTAQTTLNGALDNSQTSVVVTSGAVFPATGNFRILVESEIMKVTARSTNTLTVVRGQEGTSAASHTDGLNVTHILTADSVERMGKDNLPLWGEPTFPPLNKLVAADGVTLLTSSDFTWTNQGSATVSTLAGTIALRAPSSAGIDHHVLTVSAPSAPWTLITATRTIAMVDDNSSCSPIIGLVLRESGTGKLISFGLHRNTGSNIEHQRFGIDYWTNPTTYAGSTPFKNSKPLFHSDVLWQKIVDNSTNLIFSVSNDGVEWIDVLTVSRTAHMAGAPNQIGLTLNNGGNASAKDAVLRLLHWHTE